MEPEKEDGNIEYKRKLLNKSHSRIEQLASQMRYRCEEGNSRECIYNIGVDDDGKMLGITQAEYEETINTLNIAAETNNYSVTLLTTVPVDDEKNIYEVLIREQNENNYIDIKVAVAGNVDSGKCLSKNTKIKLYSGQDKFIQDITTEDVLMGDDGTPRIVLETTRGFGQLYEITPVNGEPFSINKNHILCFMVSTNYNYTYFDKLKKTYAVIKFSYVNNLPKLKITFFPIERKGFKYTNNIIYYETEKDAYDASQLYLDNVLKDPKTIKCNDIVELSIEQYVNLSKGEQNALKLYRTGVDYNYQDVDIDPYMIGYWLGYDTSSGYQITTIIKYFEEKLSKIKSISRNKYESSREIKTKNYNQFLDSLRKYGIIYNKHVPDCYKYNTREVRLSLIAGLIDSIGCLTCIGGYKFVMKRKDEQLCNDMVEIIRSLGFSTCPLNFIKSKNSSNCEYIKFGIDGERLQDFPVLLEKNKSNESNYSKNILTTSIKDIKILKDQEYFGFELNGNGRFLLKDFIITHNSSLLGVLTTGKKDNGRGSARLSVFNYSHEVRSGRTSSIAHHILGFNNTGEIMNYGMGKIAWPEIVQRSSKIISFFDLAGHEKYLKTTILGLASSFPDVCFIIVGANMGISRMTREHIFLCITLKIPFIIIITKIDICDNRQNVLDDTIQNINKLLKRPGIRRIPIKVRNIEDIVICAKNIHSESIVPIFHVSNVTGQGIDQIKSFLNLVGKRQRNDTNVDNVEYHIDSTFSVSGVGTVTGGHLISGTIRVGDKLLLGPNNSEYYTVTVRSIHCKRVPLQVVSHGSYVCLGLKKVDRKKIRKGNVIISTNGNRILTNTFSAQINVLRAHSTTIRPGYEPVLHACAIRQSVKLISVEEKSNARNPDKTGEDDILRTGDRAKVTFEFCFQPEYLKVGTRILLAEGRCKIVGIVI